MNPKNHYVNSSNMICEIYPLCNASWVGGKASFGSYFTRNGTLKLKKLLYSCHLNGSLRQAQMMSQSMGSVSGFWILLKENVITDRISKVHYQAESKRKKET